MNYHSTGDDKIEVKKKHMLEASYYSAGGGGERTQGDECLP